jgi:uncharacterized membrane protein
MVVRFLQSVLTWQNLAVIKYAIICMYLCYLVSAKLGLCTLLGGRWLFSATANRQGIQIHR